MSDDADRAQLLEIADRDRSIAQARAPTDPNFRWAGDCVECADPIEADRVAASPSSRRCIVCQEAFERRQKLFSRSVP
ncbi:TraR/DksA C4-type zinc finger protein [Phenylobacterium sp. 58.2.17]|uniref:TraR/DksA C4-type zinc finger protein n=1 Tax=Phenylobacterium sp. 58.2.17 TaxID=2969306 RepID=UPI0022655BA2|nr:TraR/DksA C4-type zinc finger protein [Phenylobacterium sp. 58.2.17]MCX7586555.1 TraR/DksA C4-type zinc finger protein [Phenylobacterium sp. 58.2.17]